MMQVLQHIFVSLILVVGVVSDCLPWTVSWPNTTASYTYTGSVDVNSSNVCAYRNVRFASLPYRFCAPVYPPLPNETPAPGDVSCFQIDPSGAAASLPRLGDDADGTNCTGPPHGIQREDCLFLDVYAPSGTNLSDASLPVVVWLYGGAYLYGSKQQFDASVLPFYFGDGFLDTASQSNNSNMIFVTGNYRLGAFGWLAGTYMEQNAQPNAGLLDQQAILKFVQDQLQPDPAQVSLWGESAGASSVLHHLTMPMNGSKQLFSKALVQSPAYQWLWDRNGSLNDTFTNFAKNVSSKASCPLANMDCLRNASVDIIREVNQDLLNVVLDTGIMPVGPSVDGNLVPYLAPYSLANSPELNISIVNLDTIAVSHVDLEVPPTTQTNVSSFIPLPIRQNPSDASYFEKFLLDFIPDSATSNYSCVRTSISNQYGMDQYTDQVHRAADVIAHSSFTCNARFMAEHYYYQQKPVYAMNYAVLRTFAGIRLNACRHATDLLPAFTNNMDYTPYVKCSLPNWLPLKNVTAAAIVNTMKKDVAPNMQAMFTKHAMFGDPNYGCGNSCTYTWNRAVLKTCTNFTDTCFFNVLVPETYALDRTPENVWANKTDPDFWTRSSYCSFWNQTAADVTKIASGTDVCGTAQLSILPLDKQQVALSNEL